MIKHIQRWNVWRKGNLNTKFYKFLVLIRIIHSPSLGSVYTRKEILEFNKAFEKGLRDGQNWEDNQ